MMIRPATTRDVDAIVALCAEHAAYEGGYLASGGFAAHLIRAIFADPPRLWCLTVDVRGTVDGYATYALEFSTWRAAEHIHLDCLYLRPGIRRSGVGSTIMARIAAHARALGCEAIEWQTPASNAAAIRFYDQLGAVRREKQRYTWTPQVGQ